MPEFTPNYSIPIPSDPLSQLDARRAWIAVDAALDNLTPPASFAQSADPVITHPLFVVAGSWWIDTADGQWRLKIRNSTNTAWLSPSIPFDSSYIPGMVVNLTAISIEGVADGANITTWADSSGNGNNASLIDALKPASYHTDDPDFQMPYVLLPDSGGGGGLSVPIPSTATKTVFLLVRHFGVLPLLDSAPLRFSSIAEIIGAYDTETYIGYETDGATSTAAFGYTTEWALLCWRQNGLTVDLFYNGELAATFTLFAASTTTTLQMREITKVCQLTVFDSTLSDGKVAFYSEWLSRFWRIEYQIDFIPDSTAFGNQTIFMQKRGLVGLKPLVIFNHASGETERMWRDVAGFNDLANACVEAGYIVAFSRQHGDSWGNDDALDDNQDAYDYAVANLLADPDEVVMVGDSMGGIPAMLSFPLTTIPLKGAVLIYPVQDIAHQYSINGAMATAIDAAYGGNFAVNGTGHDPIDRAASDWTGKRFIWFGSTLDSVVPYTQNTAAMRTHINGVATENTYTELSGDHNENVASTVSATLDFLARCFDSYQPVSENPSTDAQTIQGVAITGTPSVNQVPIATSATSAAWGPLPGSATSALDDLFLAEGGVINWDNGDVTLTQTGDALVLAGGRLDVRDSNIVLTDTDVAHGVTDFGDSTNMYGKLFPISSTAGGLGIWALSDTGTDSAYRLSAILGNADPTDSVPAIDLRGYKKNAGDIQALGALETVLQIQNATTPLLTVLGGGNVGIGTTGPGNPLTVRGAINGQEVIVRWERTADGAVAGGMGSFYDSENSIAVGAITNHKFKLLTNDTTRLTIDTAGNVGIGTGAFGTSAAGVLAIGNGTAPSTGPADTVQFYSSDDAAGHTIPSFFCEGTNVVATGQADSASSVRVKMRINGVVHTFLCI